MQFLVNRATGRVHRQPPQERCNTDAARRADNIAVIEADSLEDALAGRARRRPCGWCFRKAD